MYFILGDTHLGIVKMYVQLQPESAIQSAIPSRYAYVSLDKNLY